MFTMDDIMISAYEGVVKMAEDAARVKEALEYVSENAPKWTNDTCARIFGRKDRA